MFKSKFLTLNFFLITSAFVITIYLPSFSSYFFQDDWYSFLISRVSGIGDVANFFLPNNSVVYYRPLGMQIPFFLQYSFFGLNPLPFRILVLLTHLFNSILVYILFKKLLKSQIPSLLAAFLYATSGIHYIPFYWSSTYAFVLGPGLNLLTFLLFLEKKYYYSFLFFIAGLLVFEITAVLPVIICSYLLSNNEKRKCLNLIPFFLLSFFYALFRYFFLPPPDIPEYQLTLSLASLMNLKYYFLWAFNWPEEMKNQFIKFFIINPLFIRDFRIYYISFLISIFINFAAFILLPSLLILFGRIKFSLKRTIFSFIWLLVPLLPVIFFPLHTFPYYLPLPLLGFLFFFFSSYTEIQKFITKKFAPFLWIYPGIIILNWLISVFVLMDFNSKIHWAQRRAGIAKDLTVKALKIGERNTFIVKPDSENRHALNNQDAFRVIFNNPEIKTVYSDHNIEGTRL